MVQVDCGASAGTKVKASFHGAGADDLSSAKACAGELAQRQILNGFSQSCGLNGLLNALPG